MQTLEGFWTMLAHEQGGLLNTVKIAAGLGVSGQSVARYLDLLVDLMLVRRLSPWHANAGKRLEKSPKVYIRDAGLAHALLGSETTEALLGHPVVGGSWEGCCFGNLIAAAPRGTEASFYRSSGGAEIDLILKLPDQTLRKIEVKRTTSPKVTRCYQEQKRCHVRPYPSECDRHQTSDHRYQNKVEGNRAWPFRLIQATHHE
jgi:predicted AAA+ superfamily ATPase